MRRALKSLVFITSLIIIGSCNTEITQPLSKWQLVAQLMDPGDGSGSFIPVSSQKIVEFFEDGSFCSNGTLCTMDVLTTDPSTGTYNESTGIIDVDNCNVGHFPRTYETEGDTLIINYPCIEPCREKFVRIN